MLLTSQVVSKEKSIVTIVGCVILFVTGLFLVQEGVHQLYVKSGDFRYSVTEIKEKYYNGKQSGKTIEYSFMGTIYRRVCTGEICKRAKFGEKYFVKIYLKDPNIFEVVESRYDANKIKEIPYEGWRTIPVVRF